ncbi:MAG: carboxypeptidase regulatory-like domain-containing protein [Acidobacteriota bacterium]
MHTVYLRRILLGLFVFLAATYMSEALLAQTASLQGTVLDPQERAVPGADVTLIQAETGTERVTVSDDQGGFVFAQVTPGAYSLRAELPGFKTVVTENVNLRVDTATTIDVQFTELGQVSEIVTVTGEAELLNKTDATIGNVLTPTQISRLPLENRNVANLLSLQPAITREGYVAGARSDQSNLTLDGIDVNEQQTGALTTVLRVTPASVQEFRVTTANPNATHGRSAGAQISFVTKSGTNDFHGGLYYSHRNTATTANNFFNNRVEGDPDNDGEPGLARPALLRHLFGGSVGGPISQDKVFFFFNYEGRKDRKQESVLRFVPLPSLGQGQVKYENTSGEIVTLGPDELNAIYPVGVNPLAIEALAAAAARYPANDTGEGDGLNTGGFRFNAPLPLDWNTYTAKIDFNLSSEHQFFVRGNYQWDHESFAPQFPDTPAPTFWNHPAGVAAVHTWTPASNVVNQFRYGLTRQAFSSQGDSDQNLIFFRFVFEPLDFSRTLSRVTPVHNFVNDLSWVKGKHSLQLGTNIRVIRNQRDSFSNSYDEAVTNPSFYDFSGAVVSDPIADLAPGSVSVYQNAATAVIGRFSQYSGNYNFGADGSLLAPGISTAREFATEEYEFYLQDTWRVRQDLTFTYGLRFGYSAPVYESSGFQVKPTTSLGRYFEQRVASSEQGTPFNDLITVDRAGPFYDSPGWYESEWDFAPRLAAAWSPSADSGFLRALLGDSGQTVIRGGFAMLYDRIGSALAVSYDLNNALGFSSSETISANTFNVTDRPAPPFTGFGQDVRSLPGLNVPDSLVFPLTVPDDEAQRIEIALDDTLTSPVNYNWDVSWGRELPGGLFFEASYLGRAARDLMATRDIMALNNLVDPQSGMDWYTAAGELAQLRLADTPFQDVPSLPFFENLFPEMFPFGNAVCGYEGELSSTQQTYCLVSRVDGLDILDWTFVQLLIDDDGIAPNMFFHPQYAALAAWSTVAYSDYHAGAFTLRERFGQDLTVDFNYTLSKSMDNASGLQNSAFYSAIILNPLRPDDNYAESDFDVRHLINANWYWHLPFGRGQALLPDIHPGLDALLGGWEFTGILRWNSGLPEFNPFDRAQWATNWNVQSNGVRVRDPRANPNKSGDNPNFWDDPTFAYQSYRNALPGETGDRNVLRRQGFVSVDFGLAKSFRMPYAEDHTLRFRWEIFNVTNTQRLGDILGTRNGLGLGIDPQDGEPPPTFGNINEIQGTPRLMQLGLSYNF